MNKFVKIITTAGSAALIMSGTAMADPPAAFDVWSVSSGTVSFGDYDGGTAGTQTCPAGFTCGTPVTGSGFLQRQVVNNTSGVQYFQTIRRRKARPARLPLWFSPMKPSSGSAAPVCRVSNMPWSLRYPASKPPMSRHPPCLIRDGRRVGLLTICKSVNRSP